MLRSDLLGGIRHWVNQCDRYHDCLISENRNVPTRLLYLGLGSKDPEIRLIETRDHGDVGKYACLSHCWGEPKLMDGYKTTRENYLDRMRCITWSQIPRTFQEAITVARALDIEYLWIDSYCIIQNDEDDWKRQAAKMHQVYENAHITIGAASSNGPHGGLYLQRHSDNFQVSGAASSGDSFLVIGRRSPGHPWDSDPRSVKAFKPEDDQWPLMRRAWVLQERLLSPRVLYFTRHETIWECKIDMQCECGDRDVKLDWIKFDFRRGFDELEVQITEAWHQVVNAYSVLNLTKESDKLPALSGLAAKVAAVRKPDSHYLAGLWSDSIYHDLLWKVSMPLEDLPDRRTAEWRAPTWSWASLSSNIAFPYRQTVRGLCRIDYEALVMNLGNSPTGATENEWKQETMWSLTFHGLLFPAKMEVRDNKEVHMIYKGHLKAVFSLGYEWEASDRLYVDTREDELFLKDNTVFCLRIAYMKEIHSSEDSIDEYALVLRFEYDSKKYKRLGCFHHRFENDDETRSLFAQCGEEKMVEII